MPRTTTTIKRGGIFFPLSVYSPKFKVEITFHSDTTATDVSSRLLGFSIKGQKNRLKTATVELSNDLGFWVDKITGGELVSIYLDFNTGTTKRFYGKITEKFFGLTVRDGWVFEINAKQVPELANKTFSASFSGIAASTVIKDIIDDEYAGKITYANVPTINTMITKTFTSTSGIKAFEEVCEQAGYSFYIDDSNDLHVILKDSQQNTTEDIAFGTNLSTCNRVGQNFEDIKNRVIVYGKTEGGNVYYLKTANDVTSQAGLWVSDDVIRDSNVDSDSDASTTAETYLSTSAPTEGSFTIGGGIPSISPGEMIRVSIPYTELMDWATIESFTHNFSQRGGLTTSVNINKVRSIAEIQRDTNSEITATSTQTNASGMSEGVVLNFDSETNISSRTNTEIVNSELKLVSAASEGTLVTMNITADVSFTRAKYELDGENTDNCTVDISVDDGSNWTTLVLNSSTVISGSTYKFRLNLEQIDANNKPIIRAFGGYVG